MKELLVEDIKHYVKAKLDEFSNNEDAMLVADDQAVNDLDKQILSAIIPSVRKMHLQAPNVLLKGGLSIAEYPKYQLWCEATESNPQLIVEPPTLTFPASGGVQNAFVRTIMNWQVTVTDTVPVVFEQSLFKYYIVLPDDFLRLVTLQLSDWKRPIETLCTEDSAEYRKQMNKYLRGTPNKPFGALTHKQGFPNIAELFSSYTNQSELLFGLYVPIPNIKTDVYSRDYIEICEPLEYPCLNKITADVLRSIGEVQKAAIYDQLAVEPFYIDPEYARLNPVSGERFNTTKQQ